MTKYKKIAYLCPHQVHSQYFIISSIYFGMAITSELFKISTSNFQHFLVSWRPQNVKFLSAMCTGFKVGILSFCWYVLLHNVSSLLNFSDVQKLCAYLKRREFMGILGPNVAFNSDVHPAYAK